VIVEVNIVMLLIILMLFSKQTRGHHVGDPYPSSSCAS